jgi:hypothetical protein
MFYLAVEHKGTLVIKNREAKNLVIQKLPDIGQGKDARKKSA